MDIKEVDLLGEDITGHWYYRAKAKAMTRFLWDKSPMTLLDVGAGSGFFSRYLLQHTAAKEAWCVDISYTADADSSESGKAVHYRRAIDKVEVDTVLLMDVLEHVDDDAGLLQHYAKELDPGARFLISVPAFQCLWSEHDVFLEHKRRYTLSQLEKVVMEAGLNVKQSAYFFGLVLPIAASLRLMQRTAKSNGPAHSQLKKHHPVVNTLLGSLCYAELPFMKFNQIAGLTAFCLAEKA